MRRFPIKMMKKIGVKDYFDRKRADQTGLPDLAAIQEFELLCPFTEVIAKRHAVPPFLDLNNLLSLGNS